MNTLGAWEHLQEPCSWEHLGKQHLICIHCGWIRILDCTCDYHDRLHCEAHGQLNVAPTHGDLR